MARRKRFCLVSGGVDRRCAETMNMEYYESLQEALDVELSRYRDGAKVGVLTHAGCSYPYFESE